jgi:hypothetical protein
MKKKILLILLCAVVWSCSSNTHNKSKLEGAGVLNESSDKREEFYSDAENCFKQWNADNPKRPDIDYRYIDAKPGPAYQKAYKEYVKQNYGKEHSRTAIVRMYDKCPLFPDGSAVSDEDVPSMIIQTGDFIVYSVWRGPVVAKNKKTNYWFVVWDDDYHYNTKYIRSEGDGLVTMEYIDGSDIDDNTDVIHYNLNTHKYYFSKEKYTGVIWSD